MIRVEHLSKTYGTFEALGGVSFEVPAGQVCGYLGPNGAGKSTTIKILTGTLPPTSGAAQVAGFDVRAEPLEVKRRIGYLPETAPLYSTLSVEEHLALVGALHHMEPAEIDRRGSKMLSLLGIGDAKQKRIDALSKGMRQKVAICIALLHDPEVLLFDEPLSGLDANAVHIVKDIVRRLADEGKTVLYSSHLLEIVERLCERVIVLDHGRIVADGPTAELLRGSQSGTLESVFRELTAAPEEEELAEEFVESIHNRAITKTVQPAGEKSGAGNSGQKQKKKKGR